MRLGRREDVDDAAAHRELAATLHQVDAHVGGGCQVADDLVERRLLADHQLDGTQVGEALDLRLQHRAHGRHHDPHRRRARSRVHETAQDRQATTDGVRARGEPLVRQRLPGRVHGDRLVTEEHGDVGRELVGLARGGGDGQHGGGVGQRAGHERLHRGGALHRESARTLGERLDQGAVQVGREEGVEVHLPVERALRLG